MSGRIIHGDAEWHHFVAPWRRKLNDRIAIFRMEHHPKLSDEARIGRLLRRTQVWLRGEWR